jgi:sRNA-binding carbon storage regulator CsrA
MLRLTVKSGTSIFVGEDPIMPIGMISILGTRGSEVQIGIVALRENMRVYRQAVVEREAGGPKALELVIARLKQKCARRKTTSLPRRRLQSHRKTFGGTGVVAEPNAESKGDGEWLLCREGTSRPLQKLRADCK